MQDKELYVIATMRYKDAHPNLEKDDLFPNDWNSNNNYHKKIEIIAEAIQNNILVKDTNLYKQTFKELE